MQSSLVCFVAFSILHLLRAELIVNLTSKSSNTDPLKWISYCVDCPAPEAEGSLLMGLNAKFGVKDFKVTGELVYCVPNHAESTNIFNLHHFQDRIVLVDRGKISMLDKVAKIQESDALGIIIADDGSCDENFTTCRSRTGSAAEGGFAAYDNPDEWKDVDIPVVLVSLPGAERLRSLMGNQRILVKGIGFQNVTLHTGHHGHDEL